ncbi:hypothetical protein H5T87_00135 [bacterium]|nr:hypothetical protein [bacterium]
MPRMYKCPNCGTLNAEGVPPFPLCSKCGTNLVCCRYCRFFNAKTLECIHPLQLEIQAITDPDTIPASCDLFRSRLIVGEERLHRRVARTLGISAISVVILLLLIWGLFFRKIKTPAAWEFNVTFPQQLIQGSYFVLNFQINNTGTQPLTNLFLRFPYAFFNNFRIQSTIPMLNSQIRGDSFYFWLPDVLPGQTLTIQFYLIPEKEGSFSALCELLSGPKVIDGRLLRFRVAAQPGTIGAPSFTPR